MNKIRILVGSMYGNALEAAQVCERVLKGKDLTVRLTDQPQLRDITETPDELILICTSSTGMGDIPDNMMPLYCALLDDKPRLDGRSYAVLGLGDSSYERFNGAAKQMDRLLSDLGAKRVGELGLIDASIDPYPEKPAEQWAKRWVKQFKPSLLTRLFNPA